MSLLNIFKFKIDDNILEENESVKELDEITDQLDYPSVENPDILLEQAKDNYENAVNSIEYLEKKSNDLIRYLGVGTGLVGILLHYSAHNLNIYSKIIIILGFGLWIASLICALSIKTPSDYWYPSPINNAMKFMHHYWSDSNSLNVWRALAYQKSIYSYGIMGKIKSERLNRAYIFLVLSLLLFFLSFILRIILS